MTAVPLNGSNKALTCSILTNPEQLEQLRPAWADLLTRSVNNGPMLAPTWILNWWHVFGHVGGRALSVVAFSHGGTLVGLAPLLRRRHWYAPGIPFWRLEALGTGEHDSERVYSEYLGIICERGGEAQVTRALVAAIVSGALGRWDEFVIPHMDGERGLHHVLVEEFRRAGVEADCNVTENAPYAVLPATWEAYLKALPSSRRYFLKRSLRDFERWAGGYAKVHQAISPAEFEEGKRILISLHNARWSCGGHPGMFRSPRFQAFHDSVMPALLAEGALELMWLTVRNEPIAALYNIAWDGRVYFYQSGRKLDLPRNIRPGVVMQIYAMQRAIEAGRREYDFLGGASQYKLQLASSSRPLMQLRAVRASLRERVRSYAAYGVACARVWRQSAYVSSWFSAREQVKPALNVR